MRRVSIARLMIAVTFFAVIARASLHLGPPESSYNVVRDVQVGLVPLILGLLASAWHALRPPFRSWREPLRPRRWFAIVFALACVPSVLRTLRVRDDPHAWVGYIMAAATTTWDFLRPLGLGSQTETVFTRYVVMPVFLGAVVSGPPLLIALAVASTFVGVTRSFTPRTETPCAASPS